MLDDKFWTKVEKKDGCWNWHGAISGSPKLKLKYGYVRRKGHTQLVHRFVYKALVGEIPEGLTVDHICRNHLCVNPAHLRLLSRVENVMIGNSVPARNARKTHCKHGHAFTAQNTYHIPSTEHRMCIACYSKRSGKHLFPRKRGAVSLKGKEQ